nr:MAG TPA: hypothetical protein [Bacteriophage sp.]
MIRVQRLNRKRVQSNRELSKRLAAVVWKAKNFSWCDIVRICMKIRREMHA